MITASGDVIFKQDVGLAARDAEDGRLQWILAVLTLSGDTAFWSLVETPTFINVAAN